MNIKVQPDMSGAAALPRKFKPGDFVRIVDENGEAGIVFEDRGNPENESPYSVALYDDDETEDCFSADKLIPWSPNVGERVIETSDCGDRNEVGIVLANDGLTSHIKWETTTDAPYWPNKRLEPAEPITT
jgi:hypothetical protein